MPARRLRPFASTTYEFSGLGGRLPVVATCCREIGTFLELFVGLLKGLFIKEINGDEMTVEVRHLGQNFVFETLTFAIDREGGPLLSIRWEELSPTLTIRPAEDRLTFTLDGDFLDLPVAGTPLIALAEVTSALTNVGFTDGVDTGLAFSTLRSEGK